MNQFGRETCILVGLLPAIAFGAQRTDLNSFLDTDVSSTGQLVREVQTRADVRDRYLRHYGMTQNELYTYLWTMRLTDMPEAKVVTVYSIPDSGEVRVHKQRLHKGESVFVDPNGNPALLARCGNPIAQGPTNVRNMAMGVPIIEGSEVLAMEEMPTVTVVPVTLADLQPVVAMNIPPDTLMDVVSDIPPVTTTVVTEPIAVVPPPPVAPPVGGNSNGLIGILPLLGGGALIGILSSHHGGGGTPIVPAPEPASMVCLTVGAIALLKRRRN
jgi:hypothetical protein